MVVMSEWWDDENTVQTIQDFAFLLGLIKLSAKENSLTNVSFSLRPFKFPNELFQHACSIQQHINLLMDAVSQDVQFLSEVLKSVTITDEFTRKLMEIYEKVSLDNQQTCALSIQRSDYMIDQKPCTPPALKQIEINTIAASCFGLTQDKMEELFWFVKSRFCPSQEDYNIPPNKCLDVLTEGLATAWKQYANNKSYVMIVKDKVETNIYDIRPIEFLLWKKYKIPVMYKTLLQVVEQGRLGETRELIVSDHEIAVIYYRTGYKPQQYPTEKQWDARLLCEMSRASNCPSIGYQLAGTKKVQQALTVAALLERFIDDSDAASKIRATFAGIYSLEKGEESDMVIERAMSNPIDFVAKPQREGGGNNVYGNEVRGLLERIRNTPEREAYILMDRVCAPTQPGLVLWQGNNVVSPAELTCELGILGVFVRNQREVLMNVEGGYILRSKLATSNEVGINSGFGALDLPNLVQ